MKTYYWVKCLVCEDCWVAPFADEFGCLTPLNECGEFCTDCAGEVEVLDEYEGSDDE